MNTHLDPPQAWQTTPDRKMLLAPLPLRDSASATGDPLTIDDTRLGQTMDGFGASLTDSSAYVISRLPAARRDALLRDLFDPIAGIGFSVLRVPIGASDFTVKGSYTCHDLPSGVTDPELTRFSIAHDQEYILPLLRQIRRIRPDLKVMVSPWTAPAWMKTNRSLHGGWLDWPAYPAFAQYLVRFVKAYAKENVPIWSLTVQNEPRHETDKYPSMRMEPHDQARFIRDHLGPALEKAGLKTKILVWDHNWDGADFPLGVLSDAGARKYVAGVAWHGYGGTPDLQEKVRSAYPDQEMHFTESSGGEWATDFGANMRWDMENLIAGSTRYGARTVLKWNLALDEKFGPQNGGCANCRGIVTVHSRTGEVTRSEEYYAFGHASKFVRPGARYLVVPPMSDLPFAAFRNPDGSVVWVGCNARKTERALRLRAGSRSAAVALPPGAVVTVRL
ncbi:MAG: glycoside hydrolase family 30 beta sandwich domain-containing protein [Capsulimonadales bacterium]|nr:glycoside hydrolase family 30 beta sandwich domain-containing protein [Capsulimonadales bacterium]